MKASRILPDNLLIIASLLTVLFGLPIFLAAGTLKFWNGWLFLAIFVICSVIIAAINPELTKKRAGGIEKEKHQEIIKFLLTICAFGILIISGLNYRNDWSSVPAPAVIIFAFVMVGAFVMLSIVVKENSFASRVRRNSGKSENYRYGYLFYYSTSNVSCIYHHIYCFPHCLRITVLVYSCALYSIFAGFQNSK